MERNKILVILPILALIPVVEIEKANFNRTAQVVKWNIMMTWGLMSLSVFKVEEQTQYILTFTFTVPY